MDQRLELDSLLRGILGTDNVYFQPPSNVSLNYPCIVYERSSGETKYANDKPYNYRVGYQVKVIDRNPDSTIPEKIASLPMCSFSTHYKADNLNHDVFNLYY